MKDAKDKFQLKLDRETLTYTRTHTRTHIHIQSHIRRVMKSNCQRIANCCGPLIRFHLPGLPSLFHTVSVSVALSLSLYLSVLLFISFSLSLSLSSRGCYLLALGHQFANFSPACQHACLCACVCVNVCVPVYVPV